VEYSKDNGGTAREKLNSRATITQNTNRPATSPSNPNP